MNNPTSQQGLACAGAGAPVLIDWGDQFHIGIPTMLLFKDGELKATKVGATPKSDIVSWIKENLV